MQRLSSILEALPFVSGKKRALGHVGIRVYYLQKGSFFPIPLSNPAGWLVARVLALVFAQSFFSFLFKLTYPYVGIPIYINFNHVFVLDLQLVEHVNHCRVNHINADTYRVAKNRVVSMGLFGHHQIEFKSD